MPLRIPTLTFWLLIIVLTQRAAATVALKETLASLKDPPASFYSKKIPKELVEFELMTWPEVFRAIHHEGKTTALFFTGGTEDRGPQNVNGGHTLIAKELVIEIAKELGNALAMPVLPYTPNDASSQQTGTIGLTNEILDLLLERLAEQAIKTGFKNVIFLNEHGGGVEVYRNVAKRLEEKYRHPKLVDRNVHVFFADQTYQAALDALDELLVSKGVPPTIHAGVADTSLLMYFEKGRHWVRRDLLSVSVQNVSQESLIQEKTKMSPLWNGISGDGRLSKEEYGKMGRDIKIRYAVKQIRDMLKKANSI